MPTIEPGGTPTPGQPLGPRPAAPKGAEPPAPAPAPAPPAPGRPTDALATSTGASEVVLPKGGARGAAPVEAAVMFGTEAVPAAPPGPVVAMRSASGDFEIQAEHAATPPGACTKLAMKVAADGPVLRFGPATAPTVDGLALGGGGRGEPVPLAGGGTLADWGAGFHQVTTPAGDDVCVFDMGDRLAYSAELAPGRECEGAHAPGQEFDRWRPAAGQVLL